MEKFTTHTGVGVPLRRPNVDTDQILPGEYLKRVSRYGFEDALFVRWREDPDFVLNDPRYANGSVLVAGPNFGSGSSREHAVWALQQYGFAVVLATKFGDIFRGNAGKNGLLTAELDQDAIAAIWDELDAAPGTTVTADLPARRITCGAVTTTFRIDDYVAWRIENGLDDITLTTRHEADIAAYEANRPYWKPLLPVPDAVPVDDEGARDDQHV